MSWKTAPIVSQDTAPADSTPGYVAAFKRGQADRWQTAPVIDRPSAPTASPAAATAAPGPTLWQRLGLDQPLSEYQQALGRGVGDVVQGAGDALGLFGNPINQVANMMGIPQALTGKPLSTDLGHTLRDATSLPSARNATERLQSDVQSGAGAGLLTAGAADAGTLVAKAPSIAKSFLGFLADAPVMQTVAGGTGGLAAGATREAGGSPMMQLLAGLVGNIAGGGIAHTASSVRASAKARGVNLDHIPDEQLVAGSLDGSIGDTGMTPDQVKALLQSGGAAPEHFSTPETAAAAAQRIDGARATPAPNLSTGMPAGLGSKALAKRIDSVAPINRVVPPDVSIIAAPEGPIRSDDLGALAGVSRTRAADASVIEQAQARAASDPVVASILASDVPAQVKIKSVWDRIQQGASEMPNLPDVPTAPWAAPTPDAAAIGVRRAVNPDQSRIHDITAATESNGRRFGADGKLTTSSKGARGEMQVMPGTQTDPGYGVRPAQNNSADELARVGRDYIDALRKHYDGDMQRAWSAYNAGPGATDGAIAKYGASWLDHMPAETRAYVNKNMEALGGRPAPQPFRAGDYSSARGGDYSFDAIDAGAPLRARTTDNMGVAEVPETFAERRAREAASPDMATGTSTRPFRAGSAADAPFEARANDMHRDAFAKSQADLEAEWARRAQAQQEAANQQGASQRFQDERVRTEQASAGDPSGLYQGKYDQRPHQSGDSWNTTPEGFVAGKNDKPVAFRTPKEAAKWAAANKMGGDFELHSWGGAKNNTRVVLKRREGSTYGERTPPTSEPAAGRSTDQSQRALSGPEPVPAEPVRVAQPSEPITPPPAAMDRPLPASITMPDAATPRTPRGPRRPEDALTFIARKGGLRNDEGHNLRSGGREMAQYAPGGGHVFRKNGMSIDEAGEALHEAGFFPGVDRPTTTDVLELLHRAEFEPQYRPRDQHLAKEYARSEENAHYEERARIDLADVAAEHGHDLGPDETRHMVNLMAEGRTAHQAYREHLEMETQRHLDEMANAGEPVYEGNRDGTDTGRMGPSEGSSRGPEDPGARPQGAAANAGDAGRYGQGSGQQDAFGTRPGDERAALERRAAGRQRGGAAQKPPGSDGGLFDTRDTTGDFLSEQTGNGPDVQALRDYRSGKTLDAATHSRLMDKGFLEHTPGFDRARITEAGQNLLRREARTGGDAGFITGDMLVAPFRALGKLVFDKEFTDRDGPALVSAIRSTFGEPKAALAKTWDRMQAFGEASAYSADAAVRSMAGRFNSPTMIKLADIFHAEAGKTDAATSRTYPEAVKRKGGQFMGDLHGALKEHLDNPAAMGRIRDLLAEPNKSVRATVAERAAAGKVRDLLAEVLDYRRDAGEAIGEVKDGYFPRQQRLDAIAKNPAAFLRDAERVYAKAGVDDPAGAAAAWLQAATDGHLGISDGMAFASGSGAANSAKAREFGKYADEIMRPYYETNPLKALSSYVSGAVKKAEQSRRFGLPGREGSPERLAWTKEHGDRTQWDVMKSQIQSELRANGTDATNVVERLDAIRSNNLGHARADALKTSAVVSNIHAWNQLSTLAQSTAASLPELAMGFVRGGPKYGFGHMQATFSEFARNVRRLPPSDAKRYAEAVGAVSSDSALDLIRARADDPAASVGAQKLLHAFYRRNGLEQWTDAGRTAAIRTGQRFVDTLAHDLTSADARTRNRAAGYLRELGVADPKAFGASVREGVPTIADLRGDRGFAGEYATALLRFADQSVLMPTRAMKPSWASHPVGSLLFALQSYNYAFKKNVLDRVGRETLAAIKERDPQRLAAASGMVLLVATTALVQKLRHELYGTPAGAENETPAHYALETLDRSGMFGALSPLINGIEGLRYRRSIGQSLQGSVLGRVADGIDAIGGLAVGNSPDTNSAERRAAGAVYDLAVKPAIDAIGAGILRAPLGSALILGTGVRSDGGILPSDKEAFVSGMAGAKPDETAKE